MNAKFIFKDLNINSNVWTMETIIWWRLSQTQKN